MCSNSNFKSCDPKVKDVDNLWKFEEALMVQYYFDKNTTPEEMDSWDYKNLKSFEIDIYKIDRVYYMFYQSDIGWGKRFELIARMMYDGKPLYVELIARCEYPGFDYEGVGHIFVSRDPDIFMKCVLNGTEYNTEAIYKLLNEDGVHVQKDDVHDIRTKQAIKSYDE